ncbi:MAG TPA: tetratricopeptide repeat protein [Caulobacteraceae bacterium]|nr:tetratricopeptide repeat protein [Caulobacteraceae bacterium]
MDVSEQNQLTEALAHCQAGDLVSGRDLLSQILVQNPQNVLANHQMGLVAFASSDLPAAERFLRLAARLDPANPDVQSNLGVVSMAQGDLASAQEAFENAILLRPRFAEALNNLGSVLEAKGDDLAAIHCYRRALEIDPGYVDARENLNLACARAAPAWHFPMVADDERNAAYDAALRRAAPGKRVLDIGAGSGLLAMMAARAGAAEVTTCEVLEPIARVAAGIIEVNGYSNRITLHAKHSERLEIGKDMAERADLLVTETFASGVLSEAILPTIEHARRHLLTDGAAVIPRQAAARGYLLGGAAVEAQLFASRSTGFDLSGFDVLAPGKVGLHLDRLQHDVLSDDFELFRFDLMQTSFPADRRTLSVTATRRGRCIGVAQWLWLELDEQSVYENRPRQGAGANGWMHVLYRFRRPLDLDEGDQVVLLASHSRTALTVELAT